MRPTAVGSPTARRRAQKPSDEDVIVSAWDPGRAEQLAPAPALPRAEVEVVRAPRTVGRLDEEDAEAERRVRRCGARAYELGDPTGQPPVRPLSPSARFAGDVTPT